MKDLVLIPIMIAILAFGYYVMAKVDHFIEKNQCLIADRNRSEQSKLWIAAESPLLLNAVASALDVCSNANPHLSFFLCCGSVERILEKLLNEQIDIVLLNEKKDEPSVPPHISVDTAAVSANVFNFSYANEDIRIQVLWKKNLKSKDRDRVIFTLENEQWRKIHTYIDLDG